MILSRDRGYRAFHPTDRTCPLGKGRPVDSSDWDAQPSASDSASDWRSRLGERMAANGYDLPWVQQSSAEVPPEGNSGEEASDVYPFASLCDGVE